jgi:hypothetical protein
MTTQKRAAHPKLVDMARMEDAAVSAGRSAEALFGYLSRLDALRDAAGDIGREALADRAANAELDMRVVLDSGLQALNELQDLGLIDHSLHAAIKDPDAFNKIKLTEALGQIGAAFKERIPSGRWDWLATAGRLIADVELRVEVHGSHLHGIVTHSGQSTVIPLVPGGRPRARVSSSAFFSAGTDRIYTPASAIFVTTDAAPSPRVAYDTAVGGMAFAREWVYRHARNASELGAPARRGGGLPSWLSSSFLSSSRRWLPSRRQSSNSLARPAAPRLVSGRPIWASRPAFCRARRIRSTPILAKRGFSHTAPTRNEPAGVGAAA